MTASIALTRESVIDPATLGEGPATDGLKDEPTDDKFTKDELANNEFANDTLTKADRLDVAYCPAAAMLIAGGSAKSLATAEATLDAGAAPASRRPAASHANRLHVMLPRPRPRIGNGTRVAKSSRPIVPVLEAKTCSQPEGLSGILMSFSSQPRCG